MPTTPSPRERTREELLRLIRAGGGVTRADLTRLSGLSRSAVNAAVASLLADQAVTESDTAPKGPGTGSGRPGTRLRANGGPVAGIDFGHNHLHVAIADTTGAVLGDRRVEMDVDLAAEEAMDAAADLLAGLRREHGLEEIEAVVAGIPGPIDIRSGLVQSPTILSGWVGRSPVQELGRRVGVPVHVENDAALGAMGELYAGTGRDHRDFLYVKAAHGIGASLVLDGRLYRGGTGLAGEIGHTNLAGRSELCRCGNRGCLEAVVSMTSVLEQVAHTHPGVPLEEVPLGDAADAVTRRILQESGRVLGHAVSDLCNLVNPTAVIVGGDLGSGNPCFVQGVEEAVRRYALPAMADALVVAPAALGTLAELRGAIELAVRRTGLPAGPK
ncbi:ROK family protein [Nocardioides sp. CER19]|uniref:ROK family transcriptional regulator n=1 Tax=Nocardioides sp. CER19 TaxID=3038538 RepID=UPI00244A50E0|nr:ROK family protein [Nocardioides sp. CER19]MDH2413111.1 ROK family protein [Nocardioides sp. CER19]